ncbi:sugar phosphate nucleotidyltransferase [Chitinophaga sp. sic0106]|uniref:sugar phosphate nucleotidyltransferase n=1 Tax=Chitinophaga sp. sic0106 TaxID=2854785 RepID=UPI001C455E62|nr:sugar phosphate nucleotidyltransferase [Chitinophaga sp. sic0106]MBV7529007.1 NTP transferase domain-containing protein [Chitinophaga sp. sic0106]
MVAIILAGGFGTRLRTVVNDRPKPLANLGDAPFLFYLLKYLENEGVTKFVFSLGYLHEQIEAFLDESFSHLNYKVVVESTPLGTGGAVKLCTEQIEEEEILLVNADTFFELNITGLQTYYHSKNADCVIALTEMHNFDRYGVVKLNEQLRVESFIEKQPTKSGLINTGLIMLGKTALQPYFNSHSGAFSLEKDILEPNIAKINIYGMPQAGFFIDIGIPEDYNKALENISFFEGLVQE